MKKIALIVGDRIGDALTALPLVNNLAGKYPDAQITLIFQRNGIGENLLTENLNVKKITFDIDHRNTSGNIFKIFKKLIGLKNQKFDVIADVFPSTSRTAQLVRLIRANLKIGTKWFLNENFLAKNQGIYDIVIDGNGKKSIEINREIYKKLAGNDKNYAEYFEFRQVKKSMKKEGIAVFLGSQNDISRAWNINRWKQLIEMIHKFQPQKRIILVGSDNEMESSRTMKKMLKFNVKNLVNKLSIYETMSLLNGCDCLIGTDGGPIHMAGINRVRTIAIMGSSAKQWESFESIKYIRDGKYDHSLCWPTGKCRFSKKGMCTDFITPEKVFSVFKKACEGGKKK
jgi:ADP-heptose:LPS heptosyltransferase